MSTPTKKASKKAGLPPGTLIHIGNQKVEETKISIIDFDEHNFTEKETTNVEECFPFKDIPTVTWLNIDGLHDVDLIEKIGIKYGLHPLILEDVLNTNQRPKIEDFTDYLFITLKMITYDENLEKLEIEHISMVLGKNFIISFQEKPGDVFDSFRERLRTHKAKAREKKSDYVTYRIIDAIVDGYYGVMEHLSERLERLEDKILNDPKPRFLEEIQRIKKDLIILRKSVFPLREAISRLEKDESKLIDKKTIKYLRDVYDHTIQIAESIDTYRDITIGLKDIYLSSLSNKMNVVMKVLTIIATIFIPLTFIAGIYGMNFEYMPELGWKWAYPVVWGIMIAVALLMLWFFRKNKWI